MCACRAPVNLARPCGSAPTPERSRPARSIATSVSSSHAKFTKVTGSRIPVTGSPSALFEMIPSQMRCSSSRTDAGFWSKWFAGTGRASACSRSDFSAAGFVLPGEAETFERNERAFHLLLDGIPLGAGGRVLQKLRMSFDAQASSMSPDEIVGPLQTHAALKQTFRDLQQSRDGLARQIEWLRRQLFSANSE